MSINNSDPADTAGGITEWLHSLGLDQYGPLFVEQAISLDLISRLSDADLKDLGVALVGHRKMILYAASKLSAGAVSPALSAIPPSPIPAGYEAADVADHGYAGGQAMGEAVWPRGEPEPVLSEAVQGSPSVPGLAGAMEKPKRKTKGRFGGGFLLFSVLAHIIFGVIATVLVVQTLTAKRKITFAGGQKGPNASTRALEMKVSMQKKNAGGAPVQARRITTTGLARVALPNMPAMPATDTDATPAQMSGLGGTGTGLGTGIGTGVGGMSGGGGGGGGGKLTFFGMQSRKGPGQGLKGTFYDLKLTKNRKETGVSESMGGGNSYGAVVRGWVSGGLRQTYIDDYFRAKTQLYATQFMIPHMSANEAPKAYDVEEVVAPSRWVAHYKGKVSPPRSGTYYFVGLADDVLLVRFQKRIVLDASWVRVSDFNQDKIYPIPGGYGGFPKGGWVKGDGINVTAGQWYDMEVVIGERPGGGFYGVLCIEEKNGQKKDENGTPVLNLFRMADVKLPATPRNPPPYDEGGPLWQAQPEAVSTAPLSPLDQIRAAQQQPLATPPGGSQ